MKHKFVNQDYTTNFQDNIIMADLNWDNKQDLIYRMSIIFI